METPVSPSAARIRGRPRGFEPDAALEAAMVVFWTQGYEGASVAALSQAMNMPRATLYQTYKDKEGLFLAALSHYAATRAAGVALALGPKGTLKEDLEAFFVAVIGLATQEEKARGCLISCVLSDSAGVNPKFRAELDRRFAVLEARIKDRLEHEGQETVDASARSIVIASIARGIMLRARAGTPRAMLERVAADAHRLLFSDWAKSLSDT